MFEIIWNSFLLVAATEMGDKTQLLALVLTSRFRQPWAIMGGILAATILNHGLAALLGHSVAQWLSPQVLRWVLALSFFAFAAWVLVPDKDDEKVHGGAANAFFVTLVSFFLAEMGDKTQLSTVALAARFGDIVNVTIGTTFGMLLADGLAVFLGERITTVVSLKWMRWFASALFVLFGLYLLIGRGFL